MSADRAGLQCIASYSCMLGEQPLQVLVAIKIVHPSAAGDVHCKREHSALHPDAIATARCYCCSNVHQQH